MNWDDLRIIAAVRDEGTYAGASARLKIDETTVGRRLARVQRMLGLRLFEAVGRVHHEALGRTLPLNGAGACGAALCDLGFPVDILRGFALLARSAGLLGHLAEERRNPIGMDVYLTVDRNAVYEE